MTSVHAITIDDVEAETAALIGRGTVDAAQAVASSDRCLVMAEAVLERWLEAKDREPTDDAVEGFRLLALHRQGARGDPSFNACRETCREIVYQRNVIHADPDTDPSRRLALCAMTVRHLALFVGGKLQEAGLGDFCCSSRGLRANDATAASAPEHEGA